MSENVVEQVSKLARNQRISLDRSDLLRVSDWSTKYGTESTYQLEILNGPKPIPSELNGNNLQLVDPQPFVCELSGVSVIGSLALAIDSKGRYIIEESEGHSKHLVQTLGKTILNKESPIVLGNPTSIDGPVASFTGFWSSAFFHWFADYLPRLRGLEQYADNHGEFPSILVKRNRPSWVDESIRLIGMNEEHIIEWNGGQIIADKYVIPSLPRLVESDDPSGGYAPSPEALKWVRNRIRSNVGVSPESNNRILITRRSATRRNLLNENEVIKTASQFGFEAVDLTDYSLAEQVRLFAKAEAVIAPHGAGLINMIYSDDLDVFEIFGEYVNRCYYNIAGGFDFSYQYDVHKDVNGDLLIDVDHLKENIQHWVENW